MNFDLLNSICASLVLFTGMYSILSSVIFNYFVKEVMVNQKKNDSKIGYKRVTLRQKNHSQTKGSETS